MLEAGIPLIYIRNFLGHETVSTTEVYARISQASVTKILAKRNAANPIPKVGKNISYNNDDMPDFLKNAR